MPEESEVESSEQQDNANICCQSFPQSISEERDIYTDNDGYHRQHVEHDSYLSAHFSKTSVLVRFTNRFTDALSLRKYILSFSNSN